MYELSAQAYREIVGAALDGYPLEVCGLLAGPPDADGRAGSRGVVYFPCRNAAASARVYTIDPGDHLRAERTAEDAGQEINAVVHSHTHSEPYPSPTDIAAAPDPDWHYLIVSLKRDAPELRSYRIVDGTVHSEPLVVV
jgi:proteasome lid subunit RPN8/RPN11